MGNFPARRWLRRAAYIILPLVILASVYFISDMALEKVEQPSYCFRCHEVRAEFLAWQVSSHSEINCLTCHGGDNSSLSRWARRRVEARNYLIHLLGKAKYPYRKTLVPGNAVCGKCHSPNRKVTPSGDLNIPHQKHTTVTGTPCAACHVDVVHLRAAKRMEVALEKAGGQQDEAFRLLSQELQRLGPKDRLPLMGACMSCHNDKKAPDKCAVCHKKLDIPENHRAKDWNRNHGTLAREDIRYCVYCHAVLLDVARPEEKITLLQGVRGNPFCVNCHSERPVTHGPDFKLKHKFRAREDIEGCLVCHDAQKREKLSLRGIVRCSDCHHTPVTHPPNFRRIHPNIVMQKVAGQCFKCHDTTSCSFCHTSGRVSLH